MTPDAPPSGPCLLLLDCSGIQDYVFGSPRLADNVGASALVDFMLVDLAPAVLNAEPSLAPVRTDWQAAQELRITPDPASSPCRAEVLFVGGGNAAILFVDPAVARLFLERFGQQALEQAPGLRVSAALVDWQQDGLGDALRRAEQQLNRRKLSDRRRLWPLGHPVARTCRVTGLPASQMVKNDPEPDQLARLVSAVAAERRAARGLGHERLKQAFPSVVGSSSRYEFPTELNELGQRIGESHIAVVHADGNGIGARFRERREGSDQQVAQALRALSKEVARVAHTALSGLLEELVERLPELAGEDGPLTLAPAPGGRQFLPIRPIVYGGDDLTFVCDGRLGIQVAARYLELFAAGSEFSACAGVAIVRTHFPFVRAYHLAEQLAGSAKEQGTSSVEESWLDFQIAYSGLSGSITEIRSRDYGEDEQGRPRLLWRPWRVTPEGGDDFGLYRRACQYLKAQQVDRDGDQRPWSRLRVKGLREALEAGATSQVAQAYVRRIELRGAKLEQLANSPREAFEGEQSLFYDVVDSLDFTLPEFWGSADGAAIAG